MNGNNDQIKAVSEEEVEKLLGRETFRQRVKEIIEEYTDDINFVNKTRSYAGMEIDARLFRSTRYWATTIATAALTSAIGFAVGMLF